MQTQWIRKWKWHFPSKWGQSWQIWIDPCSKGLTQLCSVGILCNFPAINWRFVFLYNLFENCKRCSNRINSWIELDASPTMIRIQLTSRDISHTLQFIRYFSFKQCILLRRKSNKAIVVYVASRIWINVGKLRKLAKVSFWQKVNDEQVVLVTQL